MRSPHLSFQLPEEFLRSYHDRPVAWGFPIGGGNSLGELTFLTKYSRRQPDGSKERWWQCCQRVVEGYYSILKDHCRKGRTPWNDDKAVRSATEAYEALFTFKWTPPGRGLWMMGTDFVHAEGNSAALQNCAMLSTADITPDPTRPFVRLMEMSMLGIGVGFDTRGAGYIRVHRPREGLRTWTIPDSREGWCDSVRMLLASYFTPERTDVAFDYSLIRPAGAPIRGFGGVAAGPGPLRELHDSLRLLLDARRGTLSSVDIVDICNLIGRCVVAGNVRRSAEIALGDADDKAFLDLKDWRINPQRLGPGGWGHVSNNSVFARVGENYDHLVDRIAVTGEPGLLYLDLARAYGRLADPPDNRDYRAAGVNPCAEQTLENHECCTLVETYPINHANPHEFRRTLKFAFMYAKAVTLLATHWPESNEVMQRNRRIGCSVSGIAQFAEAHGWSELRYLYDSAYKVIRSRDRQYSEWLGVRESIKTTSVKPSGTVSLLAGVTPGVHWPVADIYLRRMRFGADDPLVETLAQAGYDVESDAITNGAAVVSFPTRGPAVRTEREVSVWEKVALAALTQRHWADNQVSVTATFSRSEADQIPAVLRAFDGQLKSLALLPLHEEGAAYAQMPYERIDDDTYERSAARLYPLDWDRLYSGDSLDATGERYCTTDRCELPAT